MNRPPGCLGRCRAGRTLGGRVGATAAALAAGAPSWAAAVPSVARAACNAQKLHASSLPGLVTRSRAAIHRPGHFRGPMYKLKNVEYLQNTFVIHWGFTLAAQWLVAAACRAR